MLTGLGTPGSGPEGHHPATSDAAKHSAARETRIAPFGHLERVYQDLMRPRTWARHDPRLTLTIKP